MLAKYAGWGGLADAFDPGKAAWKAEYEELKQLLNPEEYASAKASTTTSFYTPLPVMKAVYRALESFGLQNDAKILEPACGTGRFFGALPSFLKDAKLYGVEIDSIPARIAKKLYPAAHIRCDGFERVEYSDNRFDGVVGNVPFGNFGLADAKYDRYRFLIHDYFFAKSLDKVRPGGIVALITSAGTMDKKDNRVRKYLSDRAELIGAIRLPDSAFKSTGTRVTTDILFLQKREQLRSPEEETPEWVEITEEEYGINRYFEQHPEMILGKLELVSNEFGFSMECRLPEGMDLESALAGAVSRLHAEVPARSEDTELGTLEAPPEVKNFTFTMQDDLLYYREYDLLIPQKLKAAEQERVCGLCEIRDTVQELIRLQPLNVPDSELSGLRETLNEQYDRFVKKHGHINDSANTRLFRKDMDCNLLFALERKAEGGIYEKADIFSRRTVTPGKSLSEAETAQDALALSMNNEGKVDLEYMSSVYSKDCEEILAELGESLFLNPEKYDPEKPYQGWELAEEYLSGNVRTKLAEAQEAAKQHPELFTRNTVALEHNLPQWIEAGQIEARLGATWISKDYFTQFMVETFDTPPWMQGDGNRCVRIEYNSYNSRWTIYNKTDDTGIKAREIFGTKRANAYSILEDTLNLKTTEVKDKLDNGKYVLNPKETELARAKQTQIKNAFSQWVFKDPVRRRNLEQIYNNQFNAIRIRSYDGSQMTFPGLASSFIPRPHQKNAAARIVFGADNVLLDHKVGYGKTASTILGAYERIRLGLSNRAMFAVPNHVVGQYRDAIYSMYPDARTLIVTEADFEKANRQQFLSRIIYSDVDIIVLGHTQFERIMMSPEYQLYTLEKEVEELSSAIAGIKAQNGARFTIKQLESQREQLETNITRLQNMEKKDSLVTFEQMGVDALFVDEADMFKNCYIFSKLQNVAGVGTANSQRAADMLLKCRYLSEKGGKIVFSTGTPISNALSEMYVMQRYLQEETLHRYGIYHFDEWVSNFAEPTTSLELAPEGTGFRQRTRLSKYFNIPELMQLYRQIADVQLADIPEIIKPSIRGGEPEIVISQPSEELVDWVREGVIRCQAIRNRRIDPSEDNMLKFTMEARLASLDIRLLIPDAPFDPNCKVAQCANKLYQVYRDTMPEKGFQLVFCDSSTPNPGKFNVYAELKRLCAEKGIAESEIAFIHDAKNSKQRDTLFEKCRNGEIRVLIGSTEKCGAGTNIQNRLAALHHLDCPYRPRDIEQREGRALRQGNRYREIPIFRYVTERSFDAYLWNIVAVKQRFISQVRQGSSGQRTFEDKDEMLLSFEAVQAIATGNPLIMEKINLDNELSRLQLLKTEHRNQQFRLEDSIEKNTREIENIRQVIAKMEQDAAIVRKHSSSDTFRMTVNKIVYENREEAGAALLGIAVSQKERIMEKPICAGEYMGLKIVLFLNPFDRSVHVKVSGENSYVCDLNEASGTGTATRIDNVVKGLTESIVRKQNELKSVQQAIESAKAELGKPFPFEDDLVTGLERQAELNVLLTVEDDVKAAEPSGVKVVQEQEDELDLDMDI